MYFISLSDIERYQRADYPSGVVQNRMRNRGMVVFLTLWESIHNPAVNYLGSEVIDREAETFCGKRE